MSNILPTGAEERNQFPMADGLLYYFPAALAAVANVSKLGNDQHNPGQPMHWARGKSMDHANKIIRHLLEVGTKDSDGTRHAAKVAWRALALLQEELEREEGAPLPKNARLPDTKEAPSINKEVSTDAKRNTEGADITKQLSLKYSSKPRQTSDEDVLGPELAAAWRSAYAIPTNCS